MNIYLFELKRLVRPLIGWTFSIILVVVLLIKGFYPLMMEAETELAAMLAGYPPEFLAAFGFDIKKLFSYEGFYNMAFTYIGLIMTIMAASIALQTFAREKRAKCTDFIFTKPVARSSIFIKKLMACLTILLIVNLIYVVLIAPDFASHTPNFHITKKFVLLLLAPFFTQLVIFGLAMVYAVFAKKVRSVSGISTAFGFGAFLLSAVVALLEKESLKIIAPLKYFEPAYVVEHGTYEGVLTLVAAVILVLSFAASYIKYCRSDIAAA